LEEYLIDDDAKIVGILNTFFTAFKAIDSDADVGSAEIRSTSHLQLKPGENAKLLNEHFSESNVVEGGSPDAVIYKVDLGDDAKGHGYRVFIAKSKGYDDSLYIDISATYDGLFNPPEFFTITTDEFDRIMKRFGLEENTSNGS
jgi:hypothetical protein